MTDGGHRGGHRQGRFDLGSEILTPACCQQSSSPRRRGSGALNLNVPRHWVSAFAAMTISFVRSLCLIVLTIPGTALRLKVP
jgi:hypothetical protein